VIRFSSIVACAITLAALATAQSFDCRKASQPDEKLICQSRLLSSLDSQLAARYHAIENQSHGVDLESLVRSQLAWLANRRKCADGRSSPKAIDCIEQAYRSRLEELPAPEQTQARFFGTWKTSAILVPAAPKFNPDSSTYPDGLPAPGSTMVFEKGQMCVIAPEPERICHQLIIQVQPISAIAGGEAEADLLKIPPAAKYLTLILDGRPSFGLIRLPDGRLFADFPVCPSSPDCTFAFEPWAPADSKARVTFQN